MEPASLSISLDYKLGSQDIQYLREIFERIISFYCYKKVTHSDVSSIVDSIEEKWEYTFYVYDEHGIIKVPSVTMLKIVSLSLEGYIGMRLVSPSILVFMTSMSEKVSFYYKPWGVLVETKDLTYEQIRDIRKEISILEEKYCYFTKTPAVLEMTDRLENFHTEFDKYVVIKRDRPINQIMNTIADILVG